MADKFLIAPFKSGLIKGQTPWLTPDDAFEKLQNAYIFRGQLKKRIGSLYTGVSTTDALQQLSSRLRVSIGTTDGDGDLTVSPVPGTTFKVGGIFSIGTEILTIIDDTEGAHDLLTTGASTTHTFNVTGGVLTIKGAALSTICYYYPSEPVMGLTYYEDSTFNNHTTIAFDTKFAYQFSGNSWSRLGTATWAGNNYDYFWTTNWNGINPEDCVLFVTNFNITTPDKLKYYNGTTWADWEPKFLVAGGATDNVVRTCKIILPFKDRLLLLNTYEYDGANYKAYKNRIRFSWNGSPIDASGYAWLEPNQANAAGGGYIDLPNEEEIVSAAFVRDRLIIYAENTTWELIYIGNITLPFIWKNISHDIGSQATFSSVSVGNIILNISQTGIYLCDGLNLERVDTKIPDDIFEILHGNNQVKRIQGIQDYRTELIYWVLPQPLAADTYSFSDTILTYSYKNNTWSYFDDSITVFGFCEQSSANTWEEDYQTWEDDNSEWSSGYMALHTKTVIAGNQQGFVFFIDPGTNTNASVLQITKIAGTGNDELTVVDHNLKNNDFVKTSNFGTTDIIGEVTYVDDSTIKVNGITSATYKGGATLERVSRVSIQTKLLNPYIDKGTGVTLNNISFCFQKTSSGELTVDYTVSSAEGLMLLQESILTGTNLGSNIIKTSPYTTFEINQARLWHKFYFYANGEFVRIYLYFSDEQMQNNNVISSNFVIEGMLLETIPSLLI